MYYSRIGIGKIMGKVAGGHPAALGTLYNPSNGAAVKTGASMGCDNDSKIAVAGLSLGTGIIIGGHFLGDLFSLDICPERQWDLHQ
jgi:hypothetical protein